MDDGEKTQGVASGASEQFDPDKTTVVPNTPRPAPPSNAGYDLDPEKTHVVRESPIPPRPAGAPQGQYPSPAGPNAQRSPNGPPPQYPGTGPAPQRPATPPPANYGPPAGLSPQPGSPYSPPPMSGPANYGPPPTAAPGYGPGPQQPHGYPPQPDPYTHHDPYTQHDPYGLPPQQAGPGQPPPQSPLGAANNALAKGGSFIARLIHRGVYGELIKNPWFQQTSRQSPDQFLYIGFGIGVVLALILGQIGGLIGDILTLAMWAGLAYVFIAIGTKKAVQFVAYGICGIGAVLYGGGALLGFLAWSQLSSSPYMSGLGSSSIGTIIILQAISSTVFAVVLGWAGITVHRTIKKLSAQQ